MRTRRIVAALVIVGGLLAGCGGPNRADAAAIVGQTTIPLTVAQPAITEALTRPGFVEGLTSQGGSEADVGRGVVSQLVIRQLLPGALAEQHISVSEQQVQQHIDASGGEAKMASQTLTVGGARATARDDVELAALARAELDRLTVTADLALAQNRDQAVALAHDLAAGGARAQQALARGGTTQRTLQIRPAETPEAAQTPLIGIPAGQIAVFSVGGGQGWVVVRVTDRNLNAPPPPPDASATAKLDQASLASAGVRLLTPAAMSTGVELNPRYGVWDPVMMKAVPTAEDASLVLPVAPGETAR